MNDVKLTKEQIDQLIKEENLKTDLLSLILVDRIRFRPYLYSDGYMKENLILYVFNELDSNYYSAPFCLIKKSSKDLTHFNCIQESKFKRVNKIEKSITIWQEVEE